MKKKMKKMKKSIKRVFTSFYNLGVLRVHLYLSSSDIKRVFTD